MKARLRNLLSSNGGNVALIFALLLPVLAVAAVAGIQLSYVVNTKSAAQDVADSAALNGAQQLSSGTQGADQRAKAWAEAQLKSRSGSSTFTVSAAILDPATLKVAVDAYTPSFFGDMLPAGGFRSHAEAIAQSQAQKPLCVLIFGDSNKDDMQLKDASAISAPTCLVHSDQDIRVTGGATLSAAAVQASGSAQGAITPSAQTGAPTIDDPFKSVDLTFPASCPKSKTIDIITVSQTLAAGVHCHSLQVQNGAALTLGPGEHYFGGDLEIDDTAQVSGSDVVLVFGNDSGFAFTGASKVSFEGRTTGPYAGFVVAAARGNKHPFLLASDHVDRLLGVVYVPNSILTVTGSQTVAQYSAWTVIAALSLQLEGTAGGPGSKGGPKSQPGSPRLLVNANYAQSVVPVPTGVGPNGGVRIVK